MPGFWEGRAGLGLMEDAGVALSSRAWDSSPGPAGLGRFPGPAWMVGEQRDMMYSGCCATQLALHMGRGEWEWTPGSWAAVCPGSLSP